MDGHVVKVVGYRSGDARMTKFEESVDFLEGRLVEETI